MLDLADRRSRSTCTDHILIARSVAPSSSARVRVSPVKPLTAPSRSNKPVLHWRNAHAVDSSDSVGIAPLGMREREARSKRDAHPTTLTNLCLLILLEKRPPHRHHRANGKSHHPCRRPAQRRQSDPAPTAGAGEPTHSALCICCGHDDRRRRLHGAERLSDRRHDQSGLRQSQFPGDPGGESDHHGAIYRQGFGDLRTGGGDVAHRHAHHCRKPAPRVRQAAQ